MYFAYITELKNLRKHTNADRLLVGECFGNNVIVSTNMQEGEKGIYFPTDGKVGIEFAEHNNLLRKKDADGNNIGGFLDPDKRNIRALSLRGEKSDGLFLPIKSLEPFVDISTLKTGDKINILNGIVICEKYIPKSNTRARSENLNNNKNKKKEPKTKYLHFKEHKDTSQLDYCENEFFAGDICTISLKIHGTSTRQSYTIATTKVPRLIPFLKPKKVTEYKTVSGSRRVVLNFEKSKADGWYGDNSFREKWHNEITPKLEKGETLYGEIVGYVNEETPIMGACKNSKVSKEFVKQYGEYTFFDYGCAKGENDFYGYRMTMTNEDGIEVEYPTWFAKARVEQMGLKFVPIYETFIYTNWEDLQERVAKYYDGVDDIGKTHIKEGVVVRIENRGSFKAFKKKNYEFKVVSGIITSEIEENQIDTTDYDIVEEL